jgi:hypothetical protein
MLETTFVLMEGCVDLEEKSWRCGGEAADSPGSAAHQRVGRIKYDGVARRATRDNLDGAAGCCAMNGTTYRAIGSFPS